MEKVNDNSKICEKVSINTELYLKEDEKLEAAIAAELEIPDPEPETEDELLQKYVD